MTFTIMIIHFDTMASSLYYAAACKDGIDTKGLPRTIVEDLRNMLPQHLPGWYVYRFDDGSGKMVVCTDEEDYNVNKIIVQMYKLTCQPNTFVKNLSYAMYNLYGDLEDMILQYRSEGEGCEYRNLAAMQYCLFCLLNLEGVIFTKLSSGMHTFQRSNVDDVFISRLIPIILK
ncbi:unknown [Spodoptera litura nucleopolyhedrovirus]|uniref:Uncharacterized protein n=1 Tax=Spodoptera litura multicapsid nucleopolyhedrovirus TaxID=46242 RepID=Q91BA7_NPVST|nr:hypothetical protein [Spodoptera litura nucleopolyhedrovirus]AAL01809.1 unknown [Spodoptera litura nucleopolyhedrovirus]